MEIDQHTPLLPRLSSPQLPQSMRDLALYKDVELRIAVLLNLLPFDQRERMLKTAALRAETGPL